MAPFSTLHLLLYGLAISCSYGQDTDTSSAFNDTGPLSTFKSRPEIQAPFLNITLFDEDLVEPGYIFLAPYQTNQESVYIYDNLGNLVWSGFGPAGGGIYHNFHVCQINSTDHLCFFNGNQFLGFGRGHGVILDNTLTIASSVQVQGGLGTSDEHEFNLVDHGESALISTFGTIQHDLSAYNITKGQGWIIDNYFQKVKISTNELLFEWRALDHVDLSATYIKPNSTDVSGTGLDPFSPFDWFHINAIDQNDAGDYLVSARHTSTIYKLNGIDGSIMWQLGGASSDFSFDTGLNFSFQHDARFRAENTSTTILSLFDNASNGYNQSARYSSGMVLKLDHTTNHASLLQQYVAPHEFISASQGNIQVLGADEDWDTVNVFSGWGSNAFVAEYTNDGKMVLQGHFATSGSMNYRAFKANFTTNPTDAPASYAYAHNDSAPTVFYMSWNGATEVAHWLIYTSNSSDGTLTLTAMVPKKGFETIYTSPDFQRWSQIEALDRDGNSLRNTTRLLKTFVPGPKLAASCNEAECPATSVYGVDGDTSMGTKPERDSAVGRMDAPRAVLSIALVAVVLVVTLEIL